MRTLPSVPVVLANAELPGVFWSVLISLLPTVKYTSLVRLVVAFAGRFEIQVVPGDERRVTGGNDVAALDAKVIAGQQRGAVAAEGAGEGGGRRTGPISKQNTVPALQNLSQLCHHL